VEICHGQDSGSLDRAARYGAPLAEYEAIGESHRMTLKFRKPK